MTRRYLFWVVAIGVAALASFSIVSWWSLRTVLVPTETQTPKESALNQTEQLLTATKNNRATTLPKDEMPSYLWVSDSCWNALRSAMSQNLDQYKLSINSYYNSNESPTPARSAVEIFILVDFPNGQQVEVLYYQGGITGCSEVRSQ